jgi:LppX/LprAFG-like lipoprotein
MFKRYGFLAGGAVLALALSAGCTTNSGNSANGSGNGNGTVPVNLTPVAEIQAALTKASNDKTVTIKGTITSPMGSGSIEGQEQFGDNVEMSMNIGMAGMQLSEVLVGDTLYMKIPALSSELGGKPWAKISLGSMGTLGSTLQSLVDSAKNTDPSAQLQPLLASGDVKKVGTETVDGVQATHYSGTVNVATAFDSSQAAKNLTPSQISQLKSMLSTAGVTEETIDVWVASDGLPVEETISMNTSTGAEKVDMHLSNWGQPVTIVAPPADQVTDMTSAFGSALATPSS